MSKAVVFISHIAEEREIAQALKTLVESSFLGLIDVFVSSDANSIMLGRKWLESITHALGVCAVEIIIASPTSVKRPWVNFEAGAGWIRRIPVIPLCHTGMKPSTLPMPLSELRAASATDKDELSSLLPVLAEAIGSQLPTIDWSPFVKAVQIYESAYQAETKQIEQLQGKSPIPPTDGLLPHELATLLVVGENVAGTDDPHSVWSIRNEMESLGYTKLAAGLAITSLCRRNLMVRCSIESNYGNDGPTPGVNITDEGWAWLDANKERLALVDRTEPPLRDGDIPF